MVLALSLIMPGAAVAAEDYGPADIHRLNLGLSMGVSAINEDAAVALDVEHPSRAALEFGGALAYSTGPAIAFGGYSNYAPDRKVGDVGEAINFAVASDGQGAGLQLFMRVGLVQYFGDNAELIVRDKSSWNVALPMSWRIHQDRSRKTAWYVRLYPVIDMPNKYGQVKANIQLGWTPQPPQ
jgi:hypothetical protein